jgi:acyl carrier protein
MATAAAETAEPLIEIARATLRELRQADADSLPLTLNSTLDHDLGLDSLARVELFARIESDLGARLPEWLFETAETLGDIATALGRAPLIGPSRRRAVSNAWLQRFSTSIMGRPSRTGWRSRCLISSELP